ncbi:MAG: ATP synthase subunit I [Burkholderiaceae bacterium]|nr:ATP synthase subunit I [Burkholderiaceae bacterium]
MSHETPSPLKPAVADDEDAAAQAEFKPLSADEARQWREQHPALSPWRIVAWQAVVGSLAAGLAWLVSGRETLAGSVLYGALAVVLPASVLARAMSRQSGAAGAALAGFFVWELVKIVLTVAMLVAAPRVVPQLSWPAMLAGFVVAMKVYWVAMWLHPARRKSTAKNLN